MCYLKCMRLFAIILAVGVLSGGCAAVKTSSLEREGIEAYEASHYALAIEKWQAGLEQARELDDTRYISQFLSNLASAHAKLSRYADALDFYQQALEIYREEQDPQREASTLNNIGIVYDKLGQYQQALEAYQQALTIRHDLEDREKEANILDNIGISHYRLGHYHRSLAMHQQALDIRRMLKKSDPKDESKTLNNIGGVYESQGQYQQALDAYQQALRMSQGPDGNRAGEGKTLNNIGVVYWRLGQYQHALNYYKQALPIKHETNDERGEADILNNIGVVYWKLGHYQSALEYYRYALKIRRDSNDRRGEGSTLNNIGKAYESQRQYQQALEYYHQALAIRREIGDKRGEGSTLNNIGGVYRHLGQYQQAYETFHASLAINEALGTLDGVWAAQYGLASATRHLKQEESALLFYEQALDTIEQLRAGLTEKEHKLSFIQDKLHVYDECIELLCSLYQRYPRKGYNGKALEIFERKQGRVFLEEMGSSGARLFAGLPEIIIQNEHDMELRLEQIRQQLVDERSKPVTDQKKDIIQTLEDQETKLLAEQQALQAQIKTDYPDYYALKYPQPVSLAELQEHILQPGELMLVYNVMPEKTILWLISATRPASIDSGQALSEEEDPQAFSGKPPSPGGDSLWMYTLPVKEEELRAMVTEFRGSMLVEWHKIRGLVVPVLPEPPQKPFAQASYDLYNLLIPEEVRSLFTTISGKTLHIVPTGPLYTLPFEALVAEIPPQIPLNPPLEKAEILNVHYLIEDFPICYLSSASLLKTLREARTRRKATAPYPLLAFADPVYTSPSDDLSKQEAASQEGEKEQSLQDLRNQAYRGFLQDTFATLPETAEEARAIADLLNAPQESDPLQLQENASRPNVFAFNADESLDDYQYVLFATHGILPGEVDQVTQPALVLSYPDKHGYLTMADVFQLQFNAKLVSLSACNTGSGQRIRGEGVMGLTRAFMYAGTPVVAVTLWSVETFSAKALDVGMFEHLAAGQSPIQALRSIKLRMLQGNEGEKYTHPYYWAPFILFGDGKN